MYFVGEEILADQNLSQVLVNAFLCISKEAKPREN